MALEYQEQQILRARDMPAVLNQKAGVSSTYSELILVAGESQRDLTALNSGLSKAYACNNVLTITLARVRCEILRCSPIKYKKLLGNRLAIWAISCERISDLSKAKFSSSCFAKLFKVWQKISDEKNDPVLTQKLKDAKKTILNALPRANWGSALSLYYKWYIEVGSNYFEKQTGLSFGTLWTRNKSNNATPLHEMIDVARKIGLLPKDLKGQELLEHPIVVDALNVWRAEGSTRKRLPSMVELMGKLELAGINTTSRNLVAHPFNLTNRFADSLACYRPIQWKHVANITTYLLEIGLLQKDELLNLEQAWNSEIKQEKQSFEQAIQERATASGWSNDVLAHVFDLYSKKSSKPTLSIFKAIAYGEYYQPVFPAGLAVLVAKSKEDFEGLLNLKRNDIRLALQRAGRSSDRPEIIEGILWGLDDTTLKKIIGKTSFQATTILDKVAKIKEFGEAKLAPLLKKWLESKKPKSLTGLYHGACVHLTPTGLSNEIGHDKKTHLSIACGFEVPSLVTLKEDLEKLKTSFSPALELAWRDRFAALKVAYASNDLERCLTTFIAEKFDSRDKFLKSLGTSRGDVERFFQIIQITGTLERSKFQLLLSRIGLKESEPAFKFLMLVNEEGNVPDAIKASVSKQKLDSLRQLAEKTPENYNKFSPAQLLDERFNDKNGEVDKSLLEAFRKMPGITLGELKEGEKSENSLFINTSLRHMERGQITLNEFGALLGLVFDRDRRSGPAIALGIQKQIPSVSLFPAALPIFTSSNIEQFSRQQAIIKKEAENRLERVSMQPTALATTMWMYGARRDDFGKLRKNFGRMLCQITKADIDPAFSELEKETVRFAKNLGIIRSNNLLKRHLESSRIYHPKLIISACEEVIQGGSATLVKEVGIKFDAIYQIKAGTIIPTLPEYKKICQMAGIAWRQEYELGWRIAFRDHSKDPLLARAIMEIVYTDDLTYTHHRGRKGQFELKERALIKSFCATHNLNPRFLFDLLRKIRAGKQVEPSLIHKLMNTLGDHERSARRNFLLLLTKYHTGKGAISSWFETYGGNVEINNAFCDLCRWYHIGTIPKSAGQEPEEFQKELMKFYFNVSEKRSSLKMADLIDLLVRIPGIQMRDIYDLYCMESESSSSRPISKSSKPAPLAVHFTNEQKRFTNEEKFMLLTAELLEGTEIPIEGIIELMPQMAVRIRQMEDRIGSKETTLLMSSLGLFTRPSACFVTVERHASKISPQRFFEISRERALKQNSRSPLMKLDVAEFVKILSECSSK